MLQRARLSLRLHNRVDLFNNLPQLGTVPKVRQEGNFPTREPRRVGVFSFARHSPFFYQGLHASQAGTLQQARLQHVLMFADAVPVASRMPEVPTLKDGSGWLRACSLQNMSYMSQ